GGGGDGRPLPRALGSTLAPRSQGDGLVLVRVARTPAGTIALSGAMVPHSAFPPNVERSGVPRLRINDDGSVDTGYGCRLDRAGGGMTRQRPPPPPPPAGGPTPVPPRTHATAP